MRMGMGFGTDRGGRAASVAPHPLDYAPILFLNFTDISLMSQSSAATVAVTGVDQPVGRVADQSGFSYDAVNGNDTQRPVAKKDANNVYFVRTDGIDDVLAGDAFGFGSSAAGTVFIAYMPNGAAGAANGIYTFGPSQNTEGAASLYQYNGDGKVYTSLRGNSGTLQGGISTPTALTVVTHRFDLTTGTPNADVIRMRENGAGVVLSFIGNPTGTGTMGSGGYRLGNLYSSYPAAMDYYVYIVYDYLLSDDECSVVEAWISATCGGIF